MLEQSSEDVKVIMISVGYHFSGGEQAKAGGSLRL
jgi:hypothetical protein